MITLGVLALVSFAAGLVDAVAGGGGLVMVPALFSAFPAATPATLIGTNKVGAISGTSMAALHYSRQVRIPWSSTLPAMLAAFTFSLLGAHLLTRVPSDGLRKALPFVLVGLLVYVLANKRLGAEHRPAVSGARERWLALGGGAIIGAYDGFFGPGTGSFLMLLFVRGFGYDFLHASASTKLVNFATNLAAVLLLGFGGHIWWHVGAVLAIANILGGVVGARVAVHYGSTFVRRVFVVVVSGLVLKTSYDAFVR